MMVGSRRDDVILRRRRQRHLTSLIATFHFLLCAHVSSVDPARTEPETGVGTSASTAAAASSGKVNSSVSDGKTQLSASVSGDVIVGGLFPVHKKSSSDSRTPCGEISTTRGIQRLEAMLFTLDEINADGTLLPGITLGANILDTCSRDTYALEQALEYVRASMSDLDAGQYECADGSSARPAAGGLTAVAGVIGGAYSSVSIQVANLLRLFKIPQISYASTSAALSDKSRYELFARTVPPDNFQARAMVDIVQYFNWTYVSTVASEDDYGIMGIDSFQREARARNICIALSEKIPHSANELTFDALISNLMKKSIARVLILFLRVEDARNLLLAAKRQNITDHFVFVASDGWGNQPAPVEGNDFVAEGALTIELQSEYIPEFDAYFKNLSPLTNSRNPWFVEFWEHTHGCTFNSSLSDPDPELLPMCSGDELLTPTNYKQESKIQFVYDAVYAMAHALHRLISERCPVGAEGGGGGGGGEGVKECVKNLHIDGSSFYKDYILNVSFYDGHGGLVEFDKQGDGLGRYYILNYRRNRTTRRYEYVRVGRWSAIGLTVFDDRRVVWTGGTYDVPESRCSQPCGQDEIKNVQQGDTCCWICTKCKPWEYVKDEFTCEDCGEGYWPYEQKRSCYKLEEKYIRWNSVFAIVPVCLSIAGIALTTVVIVTFLRHWDTPIVKASGRELSFVLLSGFLVCYSMSFILIIKPSAVVCAVQRFGIGFGFSMTYASLLTKTNRISRIFDSASKSAKRPAFISPKSQLVISAILISFQVVFACVWMILEPPATRHYFLGGQRDQVILKCRIKDISFLVSLIYNMLLIIVCTVYAVKTRKIPENFNESKFIGFTMYTTCIIWLAFVPIYFGTLNSFEIQTTTLCVSISLSASVALLCLFTPKMYIIVFQPEKNVRKLTMNSTTYKKAATGSSMSGATGNHGQYPPERIKLRPAVNTPLKAGGGTTETETDKDSMASLMMDECPNNDNPDGVMVG